MMGLEEFHGQFIIECDRCHDDAAEPVWSEGRAELIARAVGYIETPYGYWYCPNCQGESDG